MILLWHAAALQVLLAVKLFEEAVVALEADEEHSLLVVGSAASEIKLFKF
jgi:hypothetical protein